MSLTRRAGLGALLAAPLASAPALATHISPLPDHEARFLALIPWLRKELPAAEALANEADRLRDEAETAAGPYPANGPGSAAVAWNARVTKGLARNGHGAARRKANDAEDALSPVLTDFMGLPMTTLLALAWKARLALYFRAYEEEVAEDLAALAEEGGPCA